MCLAQTTMVALGTVLTLFASSSTAQEGVADIVRRSSDAVVLIVVSNSGRDETALGSGFLISTDGQIVTNYHVIKEAHTAIVKLSNGAFFPVESVIASDADKDLAIVKVNGRNLPFLRLGDDETLHVGDHVVAIGSPLGLEGTVSDGIVSALREAAQMKWIQTTTPVSHGNSGGPLLDMNNHVVGVITWGVNLQLGQNLNFAAPASEVKNLLSKPAQVKALESQPTAPTKAKVDRLGTLQRIAVSSFGSSEAASLVREKLINRLVASGKVTIVEETSDADGIISGVVGADLYGRASSASIRLLTRDGRTLWGNEAKATPHFGGSTSSSIAEHLAKEFLKALAQDQAGPEGKR